MSTIATSRPSTRCRRSSRLARRWLLRRRITSIRWSTHTRSSSRSPSVRGCPSTSATLLIENESSIGVARNSCSRTASGLKPVFTSMTRRRPCERSVRSTTFVIPVSRFACTPSLIFSITFSGPTRYGSSVTTMPLRFAVTFSIRVVARVRNAPRPVRYASRTPSRPTIFPPVGRSGPGTNRIRSSSVASGCAMRCRAAATTSTRLCGAMLVAMPTAIPAAPFTSRLGIAAGSTSGWVSLLS